MNIHTFINSLKQACQKFDSWLFAPVDLFNLGLFRVVICLVLLSLYIPRQFELHEFFSEGGMLTKKDSLGIIYETYQPYFHWYIWPDAWLNYVHLALLLGITLVMLGIGGRLVQLLTWILQIGFIHRNYAVIFGADQIACIWMFYLIFAKSTASWSVLNFWKPERRLQKSDLLTSVAFRLMQFQICAIYMYTGFEKLKGNSWWEGTALWTVLGNPQMVVMDFSFVREFPLIISVMTFSTVIFEIYWPVLVWFKKTRPWLLGFGVLFHLGIGLIMALFPFSFIMLATYLFFIPSTAHIFASFEKYSKKFL